MKKKKEYKKLCKKLEQEIRQTKILKREFEQTIQELNDKRTEYQILIKQLQKLKKYDLDNKGGDL